MLRFGEPYLTGHELDDSGGGWRDGLAAHVAAQLGHLASRGHTWIALALPDRDTPLRAVRQRFADQAAAALGLPPLPPVTLPGSKSDSQPSHRTVPADSLRRILAGNPGITAVAAFDDDEALRVLAAMRSLGLTAPADLAVIGFDDNGYGALTSPALTTVHIDAEAHGRQAARAVLGLGPDPEHSPAPGRCRHPRLRLAVDDARFMAQPPGRTCAFVVASATARLQPALGATGPLDADRRPRDHLRCSPGHGPMSFQPWGHGLLDAAGGPRGHDRTLVGVRLPLGPAAGKRDDGPWPE